MTFIIFAENNVNFIKGFQRKCEFCQGIAEEMWISSNGDRKKLISSKDLGNNENVFKGSQKILIL